MENNVKTISDQVFDYVTANTDRPTMDCLSTKEIAKVFNLSVPVAFKVLNELSTKKLITKLEPIDSNNLNCCDWINNE